MVQKTVLLQLSENDFEAFFDRCFDRAIKRNRPIKPDEPATEADELLTPEETAQLLKVSKVTIWDWSKRNILNPRRIGNQIRYLRSEVIDAAKPKGGVPK